MNSAFTVRKISYGEGVERVFPLYSPRIESIDVVRRGDVRRAKLYYLRGRRGKSARIAEKTTRRDVDVPVTGEAAWNCCGARSRGARKRGLNRTPRKTLESGFKI